MCAEHARCTSAGRRDQMKKMVDFILLCVACQPDSQMCQPMLVATCFLAGITGLLGTEISLTAR